MERRMDSTASKVSSLGRKIEFLIDTLLSKGQRPDVGNDSTNPDSASPGITPNSRVELEAIGKGVRSLSGNGARMGSVSVVSHEIPSDGQPFRELGKILTNTIGRNQVILCDVINISILEFVTFTSPRLLRIYSTVSWLLW